MTTPLATEKVALRPLELADLDAVFALHNDLEIKTLTLSWPLPVTREACQSWIEARTSSTDDVSWAIVSPTGDFWGVARLVELDRLSRRAEVGLYMKNDIRGGGIGSGVVNLVISWAFSFLGLHRLEARVLASNDRALQLFDRSGFEREGVQRDREYRLGEYHDVVLFGMLAPA